MKLVLIGVALFAIGSAFAPISKAPCEGQQQYIPNGSGGFTPVTVGVDGNCLLPIAPVCTYYEETPDNFVPCIVNRTWTPKQ